MGSVFTNTIAPLFGNLLAILMLISPLPVVLRVRRTKELGALNTLPYPLTVLNCFGWIAYGIAIDDAWVVPANLVGLAAGAYFSLSVLPLLPQAEADRITAILVSAVVYFGVLGYLGVVALDGDTVDHMWGIQSVVILLAYYAIPLSSMASVIKSRNAASIYLPLAVAASANGTLWTVYGLFGTNDVNLWLPNGIGTLLGLTQVVLRLVYGARDAPSEAAAASKLPSAAVPHAVVDVDSASHIGVNGGTPDSHREGSLSRLQLLFNFRKPGESHVVHQQLATQDSAPNSGTSTPGGPGSNAFLVDSHAPLSTSPLPQHHHLASRLNQSSNAL